MTDQPTTTDQTWAERVEVALAHGTSDTNVDNARRHLDEFWPRLRAVTGTGIRATPTGPDTAPLGVLLSSAGQLASYMGTLLAAYDSLTRSMATVLAENMRLNGAAHPLRYATTTPDGQVVTGLVSDELDQLKAERDRAVAAIIVAHEHTVSGSIADRILDGYHEGQDNGQTVDDYMADGRIEPGPWRWDELKLPPFDATEVREQPGSGQPMTGVAHPADGTQAELSTEEYLATRLAAAGNEIIALREGGKPC